MPELPEVETLARQLQFLAESRPLLARVRLYRPDLRDPMPVSQLRSMEGGALLRVSRRAKYLLLEWSTGGMLSHLGMSGSWRVESGSETKWRGLHDHVALELADGRVLVFHDPRRFGVLDVYDPRASSGSHRRLHHLGPEPLDEEWTGTRLWHDLKLRTCSVKAALMDQKLVVGVGNIYAVEALFAARVRPSRRASRVTAAEADRISDEVRRVLRAAIDMGGSTIRDYRSLEKAPGDFQSWHRVYGRDGKDCLICGNIIRNRVIAGRASCFCPSCQK